MDDMSSYEAACQEAECLAIMIDQHEETSTPTDTREGTSQWHSAPAP